MTSPNVASPLITGISETSIPISIDSDRDCASPTATGEATRVAVRRLALAVVFSLIFMAAELIGGYLSGSLAIMSDAVHLLSDVATFLISLFALTWSKRKANMTTMSYGYHRAEILGALFSISTVWVMVVWILMEAVQRIRKPTPIDGKVMMATAALGVLVNICIMWLLHERHDHSHHDGHSSHGDHHPHNNIHNQLSAEQVVNHTTPNHHVHGHGNISVRAAFIHVIGDLLQSVGVLLTALLIWWRPEWRVVDPLCTFLFSAIVLSSTWVLARDTVHILMEGAPPNISLLRLRNQLGRLEGVREVHDLHVWLLSPGNAAATVHIVVDWQTRGGADSRPYEELLTQCQELFCRWGIHHVTIQVDPDHPVALHCRSQCYGNEENFYSSTTLDLSQ